MNTMYDRLKFGEECTVADYTIVSDTCPGCRALPGDHHLLWCPSQACPVCGDELFLCACKGLSNDEAERLIEGIMKLVDSELADKVVTNGSKNLDKTYLEESVKLFINRCKHN
ncbi:hypothetical protein [Desulfopila sp. IMCC35008]|uniref:hypothetical protein n=1 Tax=Desulfopila sp. IMCC35008 TaxID=2653858 RepID=UPI0013D5E242|nr:hypothetical protein [Desulfopila sp. IMCC35008]